MSNANARLLDIRHCRFRHTIAIHRTRLRGAARRRKHQALHACNKLRPALQRDRPAGERLTFGGNVGHITRNVLNICQDVVLRPLLDRFERLQRLSDARGIVTVRRVQRQQNLDRLIVAFALSDCVLPLMMLALAPVLRAQIGNHIEWTNSAKDGAVAHGCFHGR